MENKNNIRNFCIISHIDHGKSTLADRFLEITGTVPKDKMRPQYLDSMDLEREKGITIKLQPVRMELKIPKSKIQISNKFQIQNSKDSLGIGTCDLEFPSSRYILNLIDTPGHVDFSYEVSRSLAAVEGAILLVDATKGIQAQTIHNLELAQRQGLVIIPVVNKIDSIQARVGEVKLEISQILNIEKDKIFSISAKTGENVEKLLEIVIEKIPPPTINDDPFFKALILDSKYDSFKGVIAYIRIFGGKIKKGEQIYLMGGKSKTEVKEVGYFKPNLTSSEDLKDGEIGYLATGIKESGMVRVGDTIIKSQILRQRRGSPEAVNPKSQIEIEPLPGYREPKPVVFASVYPESADSFDILKEGLNKLKLSDPSFTFEQESKEMLGRGYLCGFLGSLHAEIVIERLKREFGLDLIISHPSVVYKIIDKKQKEIFIFSPSDWPASPDERSGRASRGGPASTAKRGKPETSLIQEIEEPWAKLEIIAPKSYLGKIFKILEEIEGKHIDNKFLGQEQVLLIYEVPLREIIKDFYDKLKGATQGFASMNYELLGFRKADLVKLDILIAGQKEEAFSRIVSKEKSYVEGRKIVRKLKEIFPPQQFAVPLQAVVSGKIIARETLSARKKDVLAPLYGGDYTRKKKLLEKQKKGKKKLKERSSSIKIPPKVFLEIFKSS